MALIRAVAQPDHQVRAPLPVVGHLLDRFLGDLGEASLRRVLERIQHRVVPGIEQELPHQGLGEVAVGLLDQQDVAELRGVAQIGQVVGRPAGPLQPPGQPEPELGLADQIEGDVGQRDILLDRRGVAAPFGDPVAEDQAVVAEPERVLGQGRVIHHIAPTSSGMSKKVGWR